MLKRLPPSSSCLYVLGSEGVLFWVKFYDSRRRRRRRRRRGGERRERRGGEDIIGSDITRAGQQAGQQEEGRISSVPTFVGVGWGEKWYFWKRVAGPAEGKEREEKVFFFWHQLGARKEGRNINWMWIFFPPPSPTGAAAISYVTSRGWGGKGIRNAKPIFFLFISPYLSFFFSS